MKAPQPRFSVTYEGKDITNDLTASLIDVSYTDKVEDESDEVSAGDAVAKEASSAKGDESSADEQSSAEDSDKGKQDV